MGATVYIVAFVVFSCTASAYRTNSNEENGIGIGQPISESPFLRGKNDDTHDVIDKVIGTEAQERAPYFVNIKKMSRNHVRPTGNMIILKCKADGYPTPNVTWYKNNEVLTRNLGNIRRFGHWSLELEELVTDDSGVYGCFVCNSLGCVSYNYTVDVVELIRGRPIIIEQPQNQTVVIGSNTNFTCRFISDFNMHITWIFRDTKIETTSLHPESLQVFNVTHDSEGWYTCVGTNTMGISSAGVYLEVVEKEVNATGIEKTRDAYYT